MREHAIATSINPTLEEGNKQVRGAGAFRVLWFGLLTFVVLMAHTLQADARPNSFADLTDRVSPAVVNITTSTAVARGTGPGPIVPEGSPFEDFFREFQDRNRDNGRPRRSSALGSGFVISEDGYVVTTTTSSTVPTRSSSSSSRERNSRPKWLAPTQIRISHC